MTIEAAVVSVPFGMAPYAPIHLHSLPRVRRDTGDVPSPNVPAVTADAIHLVDRKGGAGTMITMARVTLELG
jgi:hypothetical protein